MSVALLRARPDGPALRSIGLLSARLNTAKVPLTSRLSIARSLNTATRRPLPRPAFGPSSRLSIAIRSKSDAATEGASSKPSRILKVLHKTFSYCGIVFAGATIWVVGFFIYDASTYRETPSSEDIPVSELALNPRHGGPKNLPIADFLVGDYDSESMLEQKDKPRLVILGTGWGSIALLKNLNPGDYHITVVSPTNYFLFTPMLPSATVGTLGLRSLVEPVRRIIERVNGHFLKAEATDVDFSEKLVEVSQLDQNGNKRAFYLPYDKLVVGVGKSNYPEPLVETTILA